MKPRVTSFVLVFMSTATTLVQGSCFKVLSDVICIFGDDFPTCKATWNGVPCESCTMCGDTPDAPVAYACEVASMIESSNNQCNSICANVECNVGCTPCRIAPADIPAAIEAYELQQQATQEKGLLTGDPVPSSNASQVDFPVPGNDTDIIMVVHTDNHQQGVNVSGTASAPVVIDISDLVVLNTTTNNPATQQEQEEEAVEVEREPGDAVSNNPDQVGFSTETDGLLRGSQDDTEGDEANDTEDTSQGGNEGSVTSVKKEDGQSGASTCTRRQRPLWVALVSVLLLLHS